MGKIYFSSDLHFSHQKSFLYEPRGFNEVIDMNRQIVKNFNSVITDDDDLYLLGDLIMSDVMEGFDFLKELKGKLHIILGNHDGITKIALYETLPNVVEIVYATQIKYKKATFYLSHYPTMCANDIDDSPWHKNIINLFGHTHQQENFFNNNPYMYHVGCDSHNCFPIEIEEIIEDIKKKKEEISNEK